MVNNTNSIKHFNMLREQWRAAADDLATWVETRLVNRTDAYGRYKSLDDRKNGNVFTARHELTREVIRQHFAYRNEGDLIGLHTTSTSNTSRSICIDIDRHEGDIADDGANEIAAAKWYERLFAMGIRPILLDSNGRGGFHLLVLFPVPQPTFLAVKLGEQIISRWKEDGLAKKPELFPKQPHLEKGQLGNFVRLLGKHHTHPFFTRVFDGNRWLEGTEAIQLLMKEEGNNIDLGKLELQDDHTDGLQLTPKEPRTNIACLTRSTVEFLEDGAASGERNNRLFKAASDLCGNGIPCDEIFRQLLPAALRTGLPESEARKTIESAISKPRTPSLQGNDFITKPKPFPVDVLPPAMKQYVVEAAAAIACDPALIAVPMFSVLASCVGNASIVKITSDWREPIIMWTMLVGGSGDKKSPALDLVLRPLYLHQEMAFENFELERAEYEEEVRSFERRLRSSAKKAHEISPPKQPFPTRFICGDITVEALKLRLQQNPRGILLAHDEFSGWFEGLNAYRGGKGNDIAFFLTAFGGRPTIDDRKMAEPPTVFVARAAVSMTGGIQPLVLKRCLTRKMFERGLVARFLFHLVPSSAQTWPDGEISGATAEWYFKLTCELLRLGYTHQAGDPEFGPVTIGFDASARSTFRDYFDQHEKDRQNIGDPDLRAAWSKLRGYVPRIAALLFLVRNAGCSGSPTGGDCIDDVSLRGSIEIVSWFANETRRVYALSRESCLESFDRSVFEYIRRNGGRISVRDLQRASIRGIKTVTDAVSVLQRLFDRGIALWSRSGISPEDRNGGDELTLL